MARHRARHIAVRAPDMGALASDFFNRPLSIWFAGALLLFAGLLIITFHQYWSSLAAVLISLFGWVPALRGVVLLAVPKLYERVGTALEAVSVVRSIFGVLVAIGLYLAYVGWTTKPST